MYLCESWQRLSVHSIYDSSPRLQRCIGLYLASGCAFLFCIHATSKSKKVRFAIFSVQIDFFSALAFTKICWGIKSSNNDKNHIYVYAYTFLSICMRFLICAHECRNYTTCVKYLTPVELIFIYVSFFSLVMWNTFVATLYVTMYSFTRLLSYFSHFLFVFSELVAGDLHRFDYLLWFFRIFSLFPFFLVHFDLNTIVNQYVIVWYFVFVLTKEIICLK